MSLPAVRLRVGVVCDYAEEGWPSMDLVGSMLIRTLAERHEHEIEASRVQPRMPARFRRLPGVGQGGLALNADRMVGRFLDYPRALKAHRAVHDLFHVVDHSYAHLVHSLPAERTVVTCHDLDTFRSILAPDREPRGWMFRAMTRRILSGLQQAAFVTCDSAATRDAILLHGLVLPERCRIIPLGVSTVMSPVSDSTADATVARLLGPVGKSVELLHVGSTIPRKRIDVLLRVVAAVRAQRREVRLVRCGGSFTEEQARLASELGLGGDGTVVLPFLEPAELAAVYRRAAVVLQPSEAEGFGLPVVEAMACGARVIASDLPVLREVGGTAATYCSVGNIQEWSGATLGLLDADGQNHGSRELARSRAVRQAAGFSWSHFADEVVKVYHEIVAGGGSQTSLVRP